MKALWLPDRLRAFGVQVREVPGWENRGKEPFQPHGVVIHHTANPNKADAPSLNLVTNGRSDLPGPLCQVLLSRSGIAYIVAAMRANHAGAGGWKGLSGNTSVFGIEAENDGVGEPWPAKQLEAYRRVCAAMLDGIGQTAEMVCGHKEWAPTRKVDPRGIDMPAFRKSVHALLTNAPGGFLMALSDQEQADTAQRVKNLQTAMDDYVNPFLRADEGTITRKILDEIDALKAGGGQVDLDALADKVVDRVVARLAE